MDRAISDRTRHGVHIALAWTRATPGRAALLALLLTVLVPLSLILLRAPSWATSGRHQPLLSTPAIRFRELIIVDTMNDEDIPDGHCSLREAIITSNAAGSVINDCGQGTGFDEIKFGVSGTITITGSALPAIQNTNNLIIDGTGQKVMVDGAATFQVFVINSSATLALNDLTIQNGNNAAGGGGIDNLGALTITNSTISGNSAGFGGGIFNESGVGTNPTLTMTNSTLSGNSAGDGGGILNDSIVTITNSTISGNSATGASRGGGIYDAGSLTVVNSTLPAILRPAAKVAVSSITGAPRSRARSWRTIPVEIALFLRWT